MTLPGERLDPLRHLKMYGVKFVRSEIDALAPFVAPTLPEPKRPLSKPIEGVGISPEPKWNYEDVLVALIAIAEKDALMDRFKLHKRGGQARLVTWMRNWFIDKHDDCPSPSELKKRARAIMASLPSV